MPSNTAAWLTTAQARPLCVESAPYTSPLENEIVVKNGAVAINPVDAMIQDLPFPSPMPLFSVEYPSIFGIDLAGEVVEVGNSVTRFRVGDRVLGMALAVSSSKSFKKECEGAFQSYTIILENLASKIPAHMSYERAAVIPLGLGTAASGLFQKEYLELQHPSVNPKRTGHTLLIWGGATSVGSNAIQLGVAAGYEVITTASPKNFEYVKKLGASQAFDYHSPTIADELVAALKDKTTAGAYDAIGKNGAFETCAAVLLKSNGNRFVASAAPPPENIPEGIRTKWIWGSDLKNNEVGKAVFEDFLEQAMEEGKFVPAPEPHVVGKGLEYIQEGLDVWKKGVSAKKVVVNL